MVRILAVAVLASLACAQRPNFIVVFCDDVGYGDLACYGHPTIRTPELDRMAREGQRWTSFYVASPVCTPSRAALMTGRLPVRTGMCSDRRRVLFPDSKGGLPASEWTIAEALKSAGYRTACVGKWHLGHEPEYLPTRHGFDSYLGVPYSNDMDRVEGSPKGRAAFLKPRSEYWNVPLMRDEEIVARPADQRTLTKRYTDEAIRIIEAERERPFFIYLAHTMAHVPLFRSREFAGRSARGLYGDVIEEIDWSVGRILATLRRLEIDDDTIVVFTSDNGPWLTYGTQGGSAGLLRGGKGSTFEGGMRVPAICWWPGTIRPGTVTELGSTLDLLPTFCAWAGVELPGDRVLDGFDLTPVWRGEGPSPRQSMLFYRGTRLFAVRSGPFKAHFSTQSGYRQPQPVRHDPPLLYHLEHDPSERHDVGAANSEQLLNIVRLARAHSDSLPPVASQLERR